jgi:hypothetical protein
MNRFIKWLAVLALVASVGGHWAVLQSVAWTTMLARFWQSMPLAQAMAYTLDGRHPCKLCLAVQHGKQTEQKSTKLQPPQKLLLFLDLQTVALLAPAPLEAEFRFLEGIPLRSEKPPHPPPRLAASLA